MPRLRRVEAWPSTRHADSPWHADPDIAAFLGSSRGVFDLYSDELPPAGQAARTSSIRFFVEDAKRSAGFQTSVVSRCLEGFETAHVAVPVGFGELAAAERATAALDVIHETVRALGALRGWDAERLDEVRDRVQRRGLRYRWASDWKSSPGRRHQARGTYWLDDDGHGHVQLEIRRADDGTVVARSEPVRAFMTAQGFKRSAATLRWLDAEAVTAVPWTGVFDDEDRVHLDLSGPLSPLAAPAPLPATAGAEVSVAVLTGDEWADDPELPWTYLQVIDAGGSGAYGCELERATELLGADANFAAWWARGPFRTLILRVSVPDPRWREHSPKPGARKNGKDLVLQVVTERAELPPESDVEALKARAREDLHAALTALAVARELPPPPPLPTSVGARAT